MPNIKSAKKRVKVIEAKTLQNQIFKTQLRTIVKKYNAALEAGDKAAATAELANATKVIEMAASKGVYHANNAGRKVSRLAKAVNGMN